MSTFDPLAELATVSSSAAAFQDAALRHTREALDADVGLLVTGRGRAALGLEPVAEALYRRWAIYGDEIDPARAEAQRSGASTDRRVLGAGLERTRLYREVMAPVGGIESLFVVPTFRGAKVGLLMLGRTRRRFSDAELAHARALGPMLAVSITAASIGAPSMRARPTRSGALSETDRDLLDYLELGLGTAQIASARGTSFFTVRNQLSALYRKLGVANRAEAIGLRARR